MPGTHPENWFGASGLLVLVFLAGYAAITIVRTIEPSRHGARILLFQATLLLAILIVIGELLAAFKLFTPAGLLVSGGLLLLISSSATMRKVGKRTAESETSTLGEPLRARLSAQVGAVVGATAIVGLLWSIPAANSLISGMYGGDTVWYHQPLSSSLVQSHSAWTITFVDTQYLNWFYPLNSELLHAIPMAFLGTDFLSPVLGFAWLLIALLAAWCLGRPYGVQLPASLGLMALLLTPAGMARQVGDSNNDLMSVALLLVALTLTKRLTRNEDPNSTGFGKQAEISPADLGTETRLIAFSGLLLGLSAGTKLTTVIPALAIGIMCIGQVSAKNRWRLAPVIVGTAFLGGGLWYVRNFIVTGNPAPWISLGPFAKAADLLGREPASVASYLADWSIWRSWFVPGFEEKLGALWPILIMIPFLGILMSLVRGDKWCRWLGLVSAASLIGYLFLPLGAAGPPGQPTAFAVNLRYALPFLAIGSISVCLTPPTKGPNGRKFWRLACSALFAELIIIQAVVVLGHQSVIPNPQIGLAVFVSCVVLPITLGLLAVNGSVDRNVTAAIAAGVAAVLVSVLTIGQSLYSQTRYAPTSAATPKVERFGAPDMFQAFFWARDITGANIGLVGSIAQYYQYGLWGKSGTDNRVSAVGEEVASGVLRPPRTCRDWERAIAAGKYDYLVLSYSVPSRDPFAIFNEVDRGEIQVSPQYAKRVFRSGEVTIWKTAKTKQSLC